MPQEQLSMVKDPINAQRYATQRMLSPEDLAQPLYDRVNYASTGAAQLSFYSQQIGQTATLITGNGTTPGVPSATTTKAKSYRDTNMQNAGVVPTKRFTFTGLAVNYIPSTTLYSNITTACSIGQDILTLKNAGYIEFRIVDKPLLYIPLNMVPETNPIHSFSTTAANITTVSSGTLAAIPYPQFKFAIPITLNPYENFSFTMVFDGSPQLSQTMDIQAVLFGFMRRPS